MKNYIFLLGLVLNLHCLSAQTESTTIDEICECYVTLNAPQKKQGQKVLRLVTNVIEHPCATNYYREPLRTFLVYKLQLHLLNQKLDVLENYRGRLNSHFSGVLGVKDFQNSDNIDGYGTKRSISESHNSSFSKKVTDEYYNWYKIDDFTIDDFSEFENIKKEGFFKKMNDLNLQFKDFFSQGKDITLKK